MQTTQLPPPATPSPLPHALRGGCDAEAGSDGVEPHLRDRRPAASAGSLPAPIRLDEGDRAATLAHFRRLSEADRHMRFQQVMSDQAIDAYVARIDFSKAICFGVFDAQATLVAFAEAIPYRAGARLMAEAAFSTDAAWRRNGLARSLCESLGEYAAGVGVDRVVLHCQRKNAPMRALLRTIDAVTSFDDGDLEAEWNPTL